MDPLIVLIACAGFFLAGIVKGAVGIGQLTTAIAILGAFVGLRELVPLMVIPALVSNSWQALQAGGAILMIRRFWLMNLLGCLGIWLGTYVLFAVDPTILSVVLGAMIAVYALTNLTRRVMSVSPRRERLLSPPIGLVSGFLTGATGSLHLLLVAWYQAVGLDKERFIQANAVSGVVATVVWIAALASAEAFDAKVLTMSALVMVPTLIGMALGRWTRNIVSQETFRRAVFAFLFLLGLNLVRRALM